MLIYMIVMFLIDFLINVVSLFVFFLNLWLVVEDVVIVLLFNILWVVVFRDVSIILFVKIILLSNFCFFFG